MVKKILRFMIAAIGLLLGYAISDTLIVNKLLIINSNFVRISLYVVLSAIFSILFYIISPYIIKKVEDLVDKIENVVLNQPKDSLVIGLAGFIIGIIIASLLSLPLTLMKLPPVLETIAILASIIIYITLGSLGYRLALKNRDDISRFFKKKSKEDKNENYIVDSKKKRAMYIKVLDTSVLIDGRIGHIVETGFLEGDIIIPNFVLEELQLIADSADDLKRERGRRGLDIVNNLKKTKKANIIISSKDYRDVREVDIKLLKFAHESGASIVTNDFNLNKLAQVQGIKVLNINELANSVKTIVIPGEKMIVNIVKEGKEHNQGLAYLDDGTMIVVEEGKSFIGRQVQVIVTTVLQTAAGKMIFTKIIDS